MLNQTKTESVATMALEPTQLLQLVLDTIPQHVFWKDLNSVYLGCNHLFAQQAGLSNPSEIVGLTDFHLPWTEEKAEFYRECDRRVMDSNRAEVGIIESQIDSAGKPFWVETNKVPLLDEQGRVIGILGSFHDVTKIKEAEHSLQRSKELLEKRVYDRTRELSHLAQHDNLTNLANRAYFLHLLNEEIQLGEKFAMLFIDLDRFKTVNDSLGHDFGDSLLRQVAQTLRKEVRGNDLVGRFGGDEFTVMLRNVRSENEVLAFSERIHEALANAITIDETKMVVTASIGFVIDLNQRYSSADQVLRASDIAMYEAKRSGRGCHRMFDKEMLMRAAKKLTLEQEIRNGISNREFFCVYQPILNLKSNVLTEFETLVRWKHPELGDVSPGDFLPLAEETGLIVEIGQQVIRQSCEQLSKWKKECGQSADSLTVNVNLSALQLRDPNFIDSLEHIVRLNGLSPKDINLEITESMLLEENGSVEDDLQRLRSMGHRLILDDFGTGYSSLSYLHRFKVDTLKIDKSFIMSIETDYSSRAIVETILALADFLKLKVVAEGVETESQQECIRELNCPFVQGFLYAKPMLPQDAEEFLMARCTGEKALLD